MGHPISGLENKAVIFYTLELYLARLDAVIPD